MIEMIKTRMTLGLLALPFVFAGCSGDENLPGGEVNDGRVALQVSSGIQTRAFDDQWEDDDQIGIFMLNNGQNTVADGYDNVPYRVASAGTGGKAFTPSSKVIYFPTNGDKRDFIAYYRFPVRRSGRTAFRSPAPNVAYKKRSAQTNIVRRISSKGTIRHHWHTMKAASP